MAGWFVRRRKTMATEHLVSPPIGRTARRPKIKGAGLLAGKGTMVRVGRPEFDKCVIAAYPKPQLGFLPASLLVVAA